jgi:hypothetical protein
MKWVAAQQPLHRQQAPPSRPVPTNRFLRVTRATGDEATPTNQLRRDRRPVRIQARQCGPDQNLRPPATYILPFRSTSPTPVNKGHRPRPLHPLLGLRLSRRASRRPSTPIATLPALPRPRPPARPRRRRIPPVTRDPTALPPAIAAASGSAPPPHRDAGPPPPRPGLPGLWARTAPHTTGPRTSAPRGIHAPDLIAAADAASLSPPYAPASLWAPVTPGPRWLRAQQGGLSLLPGPWRQSIRNPHATLCPPRLQHPSPASCAHPDTKTMRLLCLPILGLKSMLHH